MKILMIISNHNAINTFLKRSFLSLKNSIISYFENKDNSILLFILSVLQVILLKFWTLAMDR